MNDDGTNMKAVHARTKKKALALLETTAYEFKNYGFTTFENLPSYGEVYYKPIDTFNDVYYPWRTTRYRLRYDDNGMGFYE
jgi:hypothetical protein